MSIYPVGIVVLLSSIVSTAFAIEEIKILKHHRGVQSSNFHINMKPTTAINLERHRGLQRIKGDICEKDSLIEQDGRLQQRHRGFQEVSS